MKTAFLITSEKLFDDFSNKQQIINRIKDLPASRNTVKDRIIKISEDVSKQLKSDLDNVGMFSICLDESTDVTSQARLAVFVRCACGNIMKEELVSLLSLPTTTTGKDIMNEIKQELGIKMGLDFKKIVSVTTDGATQYGRKVQWVSKISG